MNLSFGTAALAALCNSGQRLAERWGPETGREVGRRLLDLASVDIEAVERLPEARLSIDATAEATISFGDRIVVRGIIANSIDSARPTYGDPDHIIITSVEVKGSDQ